MKGILLILIVPLLMCWSGSAKAQQTGLQGINYQAIARDGKGAIMAMQPLEVRLSILDGSATGSPVYIEQHSVTTTAQGLFTLVIGQGTPQFGTFAGIPWSKGNQYLQVDIDITGAGSFTPIGVMPFMSVPYALYAANGGSGGNGTNAVSITWLGTFTAAPAGPLQNQAYYNSTDKKSYIYDSTGTWTIITEDGSPGVSVYWLGAFATEPVGATLNQAYYSTTDKKAYIYDGTAWQILSQDGIPGVSLSWLGSSATAPASPSLNQGYYNTTDRASYIYDGTAWQVLAEGGSGFVIKKIYYQPSGETVLTTSLGDSVVTDGRAWLVGGNKGTDGGNADFIGTLDTQPFMIKTNGNGTSNERIRFTSGPGIIVNGTTDTSAVNGLALFTVFSGNTDQGINADATLKNGINAYAAGNSAAIQGRNASTGYGVKGVSSAGIGIYGYASNRASVPIRGETSSINGGYGVVGATGSPGVFNNTSNYGSGVLGLGGNADGIGVLGVGNNIDYRTSIPLSTGLASYPMGAGLAGIGNPFGTYSVGMSTVGVGVLGGGTSTKPIVPAGGAGVSGSSYNVGVSGFAVASTASNPELSRWGGYFEYKTSNLYASATLVYSYLAGRLFDSGSGSNIYVGIASSGVKSTIVKDDEGKRRLLFCTEAPEVLFQDFGAGQLKGGTTHIDLERLLTRSIRVDEKHPLKVFIQLEGECNGVFVTNKSAKGFDVKELQGGKSDVPFTWQIVASRADETDASGATIGYSDARFAMAPDPMKVIMPDTGLTSTPAKAILKTEEKEVVSKAFSNLQFSTGKAVIAASSFTSLDKMATLLQAHPEWTLKLSGHTDNEGTAAFNQTLSEKRSEAVKQYLETKGVDAKRITTIGYGQTKPLTTNQTKEEREKNRRVEMEIFTEQQ
ncbi:Outer membrane protein OmpA [Chitinophaga sp. YR573]|uniref:OmpA family protein n=1 Tax=Chitinophaga sp. YR573 TaxID=1881040 RepID=UPI0008C5D50D|nr:OmpA family protein [Chitinophaga sp. YR573]SEW46512.1 Outer membrane protein OmpA [Chitinophaga sp. YR573]